MTSEELIRIIRACKRGDRASQKQLYKHFYSYGMTICCRYARNREEAREVLNDAFVKAFLKINQYTEGRSFKAWMNRIFVHTAIDHYRKYKEAAPFVDIIHAQHVEVKATALEQLTAEDILKLVQKLPPSYKMVFNLHVVEGYSHPEIAEKLGISVGTSKSNLAKARLKLKTMLQKPVDKKSSKYG
ncbi:MAG: RNA polymerase sigma factor [Bacteroidota bacterium]